MEEECELTEAIGVSRVVGWLREMDKVPNVIDHQVLIELQMS